MEEKIARIARKIRVLLDTDMDYNDIVGHFGSKDALEEVFEKIRQES